MRKGDPDRSRSYIMEERERKVVRRNGVKKYGDFMMFIIIFRGVINYKFGPKERLLFTSVPQVSPCILF